MSRDGTDNRWPRSVFGVGTEPDPRFTFANERTFLAWIRTGLGLLTAGVALIAFAGYVPARTLAIHLTAAVLIACGACAGVIALRRWMRNERAMRLGEPLPSSWGIPLLTGVLIVVALLAVVLMTL